MKATGIVRKVDELGRIVLPKELRTMLGIDIKDPLEIFTDDQYVVLKKYNPACIMCGSMKELANMNGKNICKKCIDSL